MKKIVVVGCGLSGFWAAVSSAKLRKELKKEEECEIIAINKNQYHGIRVCYYENNLEHARYNLPDYFKPLNIELVTGEVTSINNSAKIIKYIFKDNVSHQINYDKLILASGSYLKEPKIKGAKYVHNIDTYEAGVRLNNHIKKLPESNIRKGQFTAVVIGGGFTGIEIAAELPKKMKKPALLKGLENEIKVIIVTRSAIGSSLGDTIRPTILDGLNSLDISVIDERTIKSITPFEVELDNGLKLDAQTVVNTTGVVPNILKGFEDNDKDELGRLYVDSNLRVINSADSFAVGDIAAAKVDKNHYSLMTCQHGRPQGRIAGYNAMADLFDHPLIHYSQETYVTVLDMGEWGAIYAEGWDRKVVSIKETAKKTKLIINHERIRPPKNKNITDLLELAAPIIQAVPTKFS